MVVDGVRPALPLVAVWAAPFGVGLPAALPTWMQAGVVLAIAVTTMFEIARHRGRGREAKLTYQLAPIVRIRGRCEGGPACGSVRALDEADGRAVLRQVQNLQAELPTSLVARPRTQADLVHPSDTSTLDRAELVTLAFSMEVIFG